MAHERKIQDYDPLYSFLRYYVDFVLKLSYRNISYVGRENVPTDGAIIYAPNHTNALMDALVILAMDRKAKVYVASKSYGIEINLPVRTRDDIVWRGELACRWLEDNESRSWAFGDVDLTFDLVEN